MSASPFEQRTVAWLAGIAVTSFLAAIAVAILADEVVPVPSAGAHGYSRSALGHHGLIELLRARDIQVLLSEHDSAARAEEGTVLVVAEPLIIEEHGARAQSLRDMLEASSVTLVVLPKWYGLPDPANQAWLTGVELLPVDEIQPMLRALGLEAGVVRAERVSTWQTSEALPVAATPDPLMPQLLVSDQLEPLIWSDAGILLGVQRHDTAGYVLVLSDPDILSNHGLRRGQNARLAVGIIDMLRRLEGEVVFDIVVFDETLHGFQKEPSMWRALFEFPLGLATVHMLLATIVLLWASMGRFGKPLMPPPAIEPGKAYLIRNTATLLRYGSHAGHTLARYREAALRDVARALHAPRDVDGAAALERWLAQAEPAKAVTRTLAALTREVEHVQTATRGDHARAVRTAQHIHQWREEMIHGSRSRKHDQSASA